MAEYGLDMLVPASADREQLDLVDVRFCEHDGSSMAHLLYEVEGSLCRTFSSRGRAKPSVLSR